MADEQHIVQAGGQIGTSKGSPDSRGSTVTSTPIGAHARSRGLQRAKLGARQAGVDLNAKTLECRPSVLRLADAPLGQRAVVIGQPSAASA